jgi:4-aminobutyrate aminotransferase-like enzyme
MTRLADTATGGSIEHASEDSSNAIRRRVRAVEPDCLRTYTPTMAVLAKSAGAFHWTPEGRKLADFTSGVLVANLGHNPLAWWQSLLGHLGVDALPQGGTFCQAAPLTAYNAVTELETLASERLLETMRSQPGGGRCEQVLWAASGSEAIIKSLWASLARRQGAEMIIATRGGFHGKKGLAGAVTGSEEDAHRDPRVRFIGFPRQECISVQRRNEPIDLAPYKAELDALVNELGSRIACLVTEPYLGGGGSFHPQKEYLQLLERFCRENDVVLILDEVQANFGRTGPMFAYTHYGIEPDIVCLGKGLGNGVAVSATVGRADLFAGLRYGEASDTWSANPLSSAAVLATLEAFASGEVLEHAARLSEIVQRGLLRLTELPLVEHVRGEGMVWGIQCAGVGTLTPDEVACSCVECCYLGDAQGRAIHLLGPLAGNVLRVSPPLTMALEDAECYLDAMYGLFASLGEKLAS